MLDIILYKKFVIISTSFGIFFELENYHLKNLKVLLARKIKFKIVTQLRCREI